MAPTFSSMGTGLNNTATLRSSPKVRTSPYKSSAPKNGPAQLRLNLKKVIGTTCTSPNTFDVLPSAACFAYTAGAVGVVCTVEADGKITQRFFGARPNALGRCPPTPSTPTPFTLASSPNLRNRSVARPRESNGGSYFPSPGKEGHSPPGIKKTTHKERVKSLTCLSLSRDGKLLALGETGHKPRILIFATGADMTSDVPLISIQEHTFGVHCLAFSPDSQYLASMGELNDGFLHIWKIDRRNATATLHASNKCTSNTRNIAWLGMKLVTVGTRHVKIWRFETDDLEGSSRVRSDTDPISILAGRNVVLGALMNQIYVTALALSPDKALVCSEHGDICILTDSDTLPSFTKVAEASFDISANDVHSSGKVMIAGPSCSGLHFELDDLLHFPIATRSPALLQRNRCYAQSQPRATAALGFLANQLVSLDVDRNIHLTSLNAENPLSVSDSTTSQMPAHSAAVLGVRSVPIPNELNALYLTWSADGMVRFWDKNGMLRHTESVQLDHTQHYMEQPNELTIVRMFCKLRFLVCGDRLGALRIQEMAGSSCMKSVKAHANEITDIAVFEDEQAVYIATAGRDRFVQLFQWTGSALNLVQTLDEHVAAVTHVAFNDDGKVLMSCSTDRSIVIREMATESEATDKAPVFWKLRSINFKSTPLSMCLSQPQRGSVFLANADRHVLNYSIQSGNLISSFKSFDAEGVEPVILNAIAICSLGPQIDLLVCVANADKSIRVYDESGRLLACEYGHADGITGLAVMEVLDGSEFDKILVTTAIDGTVFMWRLSFGAEATQPSSISGGTSETSPLKLMLALETPLRRVLSSTEVVRLQNLRISQDEGTASIGIIDEHPTHTRARRPSKLSISQTPDGKTFSPRAMRCTLPSPTVAGGSRSQSKVAHSPSPVRRPLKPLQRPRSVNSTPSPRTRIAKQVIGVDQADTGATEESLSPELSPPGELGSDEVCRNLQAFRAQLTTSLDLSLPPEQARELERELTALLSVLTEKTAASQESQSTSAQAVDALCISDG